MNFWLFITPNLTKSHEHCQNGYFDHDVQPLFLYKMFSIAHCYHILLMFFYQGSPVKFFVRKPSAMLVCGHWRQGAAASLPLMAQLLHDNTQY